MKAFEITLTFRVETGSADAALEIARNGMGQVINTDVVEIETCGFCGKEWPTTVRLSWVDENKQACDSERCTACVPMGKVA